MIFTKKQILGSTQDFAYQVHHNDTSGHDFLHIERVVNNAKTIAEHTGADSFICQMAAYLHDIADEKISADPEKSKQQIIQFLIEQGLSTKDRTHIMEIITTMSFRGGANKQPPRTLEGKVVQDADRLDALGAIGIARVMAYSGHTARPIHDPSIPVRDQMTVAEYRSNRGTAITHFYEKLLKLKDLMNTDYGRHMAEGRHKVMEEYLEQFYAEWDGKR
ncbi:HD domain-containing protein [Thermoactinomyces sp. DSM 45892]|uniref:HD domain-containing protein n=1 Tax=Thermoactinomyces sp. DSM 45892 TaxID=1882753 RepID=UPI00089BFB2E|nr:HD domain-containing protein [Thermoactinomyces sp. DSM 45892]SDX98354.1 uncharacterized protein SAMN05444416_101168 [Thermoactinomyces sp. DSM 45892]